MCGCKEYMNSGVVVDEMKSKCVMYYLHVPHVLLNLFFKIHLGSPEAGQNGISVKIVNACKKGVSFFKCN